MKLGHGNCHKSHGKVMEKSWKFVGKNVYEPCSALWHKFTVLQQDIQRMLVNFFWSGQHWVRSAVLFLPVQEGGQGLVDIRSRLMAFRLQAAQRLLYNSDIAWLNTAVALLRKVGNMGLDKHLF